jgi:hypothetical protein
VKDTADKIRRILSDEDPLFAKVKRLAPEGPARQMLRTELTNLKDRIQIIIDSIVADKKPRTIK